MNGLVQNTGGNTPNLFAAMQGGFGAQTGFGFGTANGSSGYAPGGNMFDPFGANQMMNGIGQQHSQMTQMMNQMMNVMMMMTQMIMVKQMQAMMSSMANFGGSSGGGSGVSDFLGGSSGGGTSSVGSSAPAATSSDFGNVGGWGAQLAKYAGDNANGPGGYCFKWVAQALRKFGVNTSGASAYMAADQLAKSDKFREVSVQPKDLVKLPAGAVVVWNKGAGHPHGHISIALGNGKEASDKLRQQITNYGTSVRVFLPK